MRGTDERNVRRRAARVWVGYLVLLVASVPWYFPGGLGGPLVFGLPLWCAVSLACYAAAAALTVWKLDLLWAASVGAPDDGEGGGAD